jgi:hypothetical protein
MSYVKIYHHQTKRRISGIPDDLMKESDESMSDGKRSEL